MHLNAFPLILAISSLAAALPLEGAANPHLNARTKTYAIVNVDGGSTSAPPKPTTVVENTTETVKVTDAPTTVTDKVTATTTPTSTPKSSPSKPAQQQTPAPTPSVVTIVVTESAAPTEYYDNGLWHTSYPVKTFATAVAASA
jgi:hypothetical protein